MTLSLFFSSKCPKILIGFSKGNNRPSPISQSPSHCKRPSTPFLKWPPFSPSCSLLSQSRLSVDRLTIPRGAAFTGGGGSQNPKGLKRKGQQIADCFGSYSSPRQRNCAGLGPLNRPTSAKRRWGGVAASAPQTRCAFPPRPVPGLLGTDCFRKVQHKEGGKRDPRLPRAQRQV